MAVKSAARLVPGVDQAITQGTKTVVEPLAQKVLKPFLSNLPVIGKNSDQIMESVAKQSPIMFGRVNPSTIDGIKYALDNNVTIKNAQGIEIPIDEKLVTKSFKNDELVNIHHMGSKGKEAFEDTTTKTNINNVIDEVDPLESTAPKLTTKSEFQARNMPKGKELIQQRQVARELRDSLKDMPPSRKEDYYSRGSSIGPVNSRQVMLWIKDQKKKALAGIPKEAGGVKWGPKGQFEGSEIEGMPFQNLHHEYQKAVGFSYIQQAWKLVDQGDATVDDIINLNHIAEEYGVPLGDFGVKPYHKLAHDTSHQTLIDQGVQKTGNELKEQLGTITGFKNMNELTQDFIKSLEQLAVPMQRSMDLHERAYMMIPEADTIRFFQLKTVKDQLTGELRNKYFQLTGKKLPEIPTKVKAKGTIVEWILKKTEDPEIVGIAEQLQLVRNERDELGASIKNALPPQIKKDVKGDVDKLERWIENQEQVGIDTGSDEHRLRLGSLEEANTPKLDPELEARAPKTEEERLLNIQRIKAGAPYAN